MNMLLVLLKGMGGRNMLLVLGEGRRVSQCVTRRRVHEYVTGSRYGKVNVSDKRTIRFVQIFSQNILNNA